MALFLGGPLNGQRLDVGDRNQWVYPEPSRPAYLPAHEEEKVARNYVSKMTVYVRQRIAMARFESVSIFFPEGFTEWLQMSALRTYLE